MDMETLRSQAKNPSGKTTASRPALPMDSPLSHPSWIAFMQFCQELGHGEIEKLKIQDGLPVIAETVRRKVKFT